jgi:chromosome partitioning protein
MEVAMHLVALTSFKGGSGKTTTLMAAASALAQRGMRVGLFEADENEPLAAWRRTARSRGTWDDLCTVYPALDIPQFETAYEAAEADGCEIVLIDTRGGGSEFNQVILMNAAMVIIPSGLTVLEVNESLQTMRYVVEFQKRVRQSCPVALALNRTPTGRLSSSEQDSLDTVSALPCVDARLPARQAFADISGLGHLHLYHRMLLESPGKRIAASHLAVALAEARAFVDELLTALAEEDA